MVKKLNNDGSPKFAHHSTLGFSLRVDWPLIVLHFSERGRTQEETLSRSSCVRPTTMKRRPGPDLDRTELVEELAKRCIPQRQGFRTF